MAPGAVRLRQCSLILCVPNDAGPRAVRVLLYAAGNAPYVNYNEAKIARVDGGNPRKNTVLKLY